MPESNDSTSVKRIKETIAGASPSANTWTLVTLSTDEVLVLRVFVVMRDDAAASDYAVLFAEGIAANPGGGAAMMLGSPQVDTRNWLNEPQIGGNGNDLEITVVSNLAQIDVEIRVEVERLG